MRGSPPPARRDLPGPGPGDAAPLVFCVLWTSGRDPTVDGVLRAQGLRVPGDPIEVLDLLADRPTPACLWEELREFLGECAVIVPEWEPFARWCAHLAGASDEVPHGIGLDELVALLVPGRLAARGARLVRSLTGAAGPERAPAALALT